MIEIKVSQVFYIFPNFLLSFSKNKEGKLASGGGTNWIASLQPR
jgi:hypothetical protein